MSDAPGTAGHERSQSTTSLSRFYHGTNGEPQHEDLTDPSLDFCNAFWGQGDRGYEVIMTRLRGAAKTVEELKAYWKERAAIEEDYAKRLSKLSKSQLGNNEIGDLAKALRTIQTETANQASYHLQLSTEIHQTVEQPTAEFGNKLANLKKGQQASIEKSWRNKGLQEGHVAKAHDRYEKDCLKLNSYTANMQLVQGRERDDLESKMDKVRRTIGSEEQDFRNFVSVLEQTSSKWQNEWRTFTDLVQDYEDERLSMTKDIVWTYANAVSQVCVEDDSSCERIREQLEQFEPVNDMVSFVKGWGTGGQIPDPPRFIDYGRGEYPTQPGFHMAQFRRLSERPPLQPAVRAVESEPEPGGPGPVSAGPTATAGAASVPAPVAHDTPREPEPETTSGALRDSQTQSSSQNEYYPDIPPAPPGKDDGNNAPPQEGMRGLQLSDPPVPSSPPATSTGYKPPFGMPMPGMAAIGGAAAGAAVAAGASSAFGGGSSSSSSKPFGDMGPPPVPPTMGSSGQFNAGPPSPSARDVQDDEDPMARALAELRQNPPGPNSVRRAPSQRRAESSYSAGGAMNRPGSGVASGSSVSHNPQQGRAPSPAPSNHTRTSYHTPAPAPARASVGSGLIPPATGHTAAQLAKSMDDFQSRGQRGSVNYNSYADSLVGAHPSSRPTSPAPSNRAPSPAMMQAPTQPTSHIADDVLPRYGQAFPGERSRSRPASVYSAHSRPGSVVGVPPSQHQQHQQQEDVAPREAFAGIGAGNAARSPSPRPHSFRAPSPGPAADQGALGPPTLGIALDAGGGVAHDSMAEQYRRQYEQQRQASAPQQQAHQSPQLQHTAPPHDRQGSVYSNFGLPQTQSPPPDAFQPRMSGSFGQPAPSHSPSSFQQQSFSGHPQAQQYSQPQPQAQHSQYAQPAQPQYDPYGQPTQQQPQAQAQHQFNQYGQPQAQAQTQQQPQQHQQQQQPQHSYSSNSYGYSGHPQGQQGQQPSYDAYQQQQNGYGQQQQPYRAPSPSPQHQQYQRGPSPQPQHQQYQRAPSPQPQNQQQYQRAPSPQPQYQPPAQQQQQHRSTPSPVPAQPPANPTPTGQWAANGLPVLFYVRAVYPYQAQSPVEFDFQADDIIAVTSTPEDGWWSGELLDEARRKPGQTDFPSNFVELF